MERKGLILNIQKFSINDGPGIRTTVFFKGCPLQCKWCSNPESQRGRTELMHFARKCTHCGRCFRACPNGAIRFSPEEGPLIDRSKCIRCGTCAKACLSDAMRMSGKEVSVQDVMKVVRRDNHYYAPFRAEAISSLLSAVSGNHLVAAFFIITAFRQERMVWQKKCRELSLPVCRFYQRYYNRIPKHEQGAFCRFFAKYRQIFDWIDHGFSISIRKV